MIAIRQETLGPLHPDYARSLSALGRLARRQDRLDEAESQFRKAFTVFSSALGPDNQDYRDARDGLSAALEDIASRREKAGDLPGAIRACASAAIWSGSVTAPLTGISGR